MKKTHQVTAIIEREDDAYVALCPELDIASQGDTVEICPEEPDRGLGVVLRVGRSHRGRAAAARRSVRDAR